MTRKSLKVSSAFCAVLFASSMTSAEEVKPLFRRDLPNIPGKTFTAVEVDFAPGSKATPHRHGQAFVFAYVLSGTIRSRLEGEAAQIYRTGQSWFEPPGAHHVLTRNLSHASPARLLVVFVADPGASLKTADDASALLPPTSRQATAH